jgi:thiol:disulfide interchange protein DsbD
MRRSLVLIAALVLAFTARPAFAKSRSADVVGITAVQLDHPPRSGADSTLTVKAQVLPGWHINSDHPLSPDYIPTELKLKLPEGITAGAIEYPAAEQTKLDFSSEKLSVFTGAIEFRVPLKTAADFSPKEDLPATITIDYQACNNRQCLRPTSTSSEVNLAAMTAAPLSAAQGAPAAPTGAGVEREFFTHGYVLGFLLVLLGGLALNLTPCVYPLIGVTIAYFGNQGGGPRRVVILAILYVFGIAMMFSALGVAVALSGGLFGAAMQNPYVLAAIAAMMLALAASSFGLFTLQPPQFMAQWAGAARPGYAGSFLMGLGMGVVAAPCIGPIVLGLLLMVERSGSAIFGFALFFTLAVGMGLPYIALALAAGSIRRLPRSGEWLAWVEQLFGFILVGLAIYFLDPVVPHHWMTRALPYYAAAVGIFLGFISPAGRGWRPFLVIRSVIGIAATAALIFLLIPRATPKPLDFQPYDAALLDTAATMKKPVLLDFRADWCIPCREMEHSTFIDPKVVREASRFIRIRADLTAQDKRNAAIISKFNIQGVPTTVLIDSGGKIRQQTVGYIGPKEMLEDLKQTD